MSFNYLCSWFPASSACTRAWTTWTSSWAASSSDRWPRWRREAPSSDPPSGVWWPISSSDSSGEIASGSRTEDRRALSRRVRKGGGEKMLISFDVFCLGQVDAIRDSSLARVLCDNGDNIQLMQPLAFKTAKGM